MDVTRSDIKALLSRSTNKHRVTSVYLSTDGARYPRAADYEARLDSLLRSCLDDVKDFHGAIREGVEADCQLISRWVRTEFKRAGVKGLGMFSSGGNFIDRVEVGEPFRNVARVADQPYVVPLEAMLGRHHHLGLALVERGHARLLRYRLGRVVEYTDVTSEVPGQHAMGGWAQARFSRSVEDAVLHHYKEAAETFRKVHADDPLDALLLSGPPAEVAEFRRHLHTYLEQIVHGVTSLPPNPSSDDLLETFTELEQELVSQRRAALLERLAAGAGQAEHVAWGVRHVLEAANSRRIDTLFVVEGAGQPGYRSESGVLALHEVEAQAYSGVVMPVDDLFDEIIEMVVRDGGRVELFRDTSRLDSHPIAALLRF